MPRSGGHDAIHEPPVGRDRELGLVTETLTGRGPRALLVDGEPGIGKSYLLDAAVQAAGESGVRILRGRCPHGGGAPAYWPWVQVLRRLAHHFRLPAPERDGERVLATLAPDLFEGPLDRDGRSTAHEHRFELYATVVETLNRAAGAQGVAVVLDDLHAADEPTLELLAFAATEAGPGVRFVVAFRGHELDEAAQRSTTSLQSVGHRLRLAPLEPGDVATAMEQLVGHPVDLSTAERVASLTGGNPLFVREVTRLLSSRGRIDQALRARDLGTIPPEIREVIRQRVMPLGSEIVEALTSAAVIGRDFGFTRLRRVTGSSTNALLDALGQAREAGLVDEVRGEVGSYRFNHELVRATLYDDLPARRRLELHLQTADALEELHGSGEGEHVAELAHHLYEATLVAEPERVARSLAHAGARSMRLLAFTDAARHFGRALEVLAAAGAPDLDWRTDLLIDRGRALRRAGSEQTRACLVEAGDAARSLGDAERFARAALEMQRGIATIGTSPVVDRELITHLEEALDRLPARDSVLRVQVMALLAETGYWDGNLDRWKVLTDDAVAMARRLDDDGVLARALMAQHFVIWRPGTASQRIDIAAELIAIGERTRDAELTFMGHDVRLTAFLELGDIVSARAQLNAVRTLYDELRQPLVEWALARWDACFALMEGRLEDGEAAMARTAEQGARLQDHDAAAQYFGIQSFILVQERGQLADIEDAFREEAERHPHLAGYRSGLAFIQALTGQEDRARLEVRRFVERGLDTITRDQTWMAATGLLCRATALVGEPSWNRQVFEMVAPYCDSCVIVGDGTAYGGAMSQFAALCAWKAGDLEQAEELFVHGITRNEHMGARPYAARAQVDLARMLRERGHENDVARARTLLQSAGETARACGMTALVAEIEAMATGTDPAGRPETTGDRRARLSFTGELWAVSLDAETIHLPDVKGLGYLAALVAAPGREIHVLDLAGGMSANAADPAPDGVTPAFGDAGPVIDSEARARYTARLEELRDDLDEAEAHHDTERASRAREEIDAIASQLVEAIGLGGRDRPANSRVERARVSVTKALRSAIGRIEEHLPELGRHLDGAVRTGVFCSYSPDPSSSITWERELL